MSTNPELSRMSLVLSEAMRDFIIDLGAELHRRKLTLTDFVCEAVLEKNEREKILKKTVPHEKIARPSKKK